MDPVVDQSALDGDVVVADVRWYLDGRSGADAYAAGHLPGAVFVDLDRWLAGPPGPGTGRHPLPDPAVFAEGMSGLGISDDSVVVAYDDAGGTVAARLVWMLRALGTPAALLDGGLPAYTGPLTTERVDPRRAEFTVRAWPKPQMANVDDATSTTNVVIDARAPERYRGDTEPVDPRAGHIPGALNLPCRENLAADGRFRPPEELAARFAAAGIGAAAGADGADASRVVSYCGSGVTACHNLIALEYAGRGRGRLYPGSWSEYCSDPDRAIATGP